MSVVKGLAIATRSSLVLTFGLLISSSQNLRNKFTPATVRDSKYDSSPI